MTHTVISSATKEVVIGFDRPFVMIGERINPTGRKLLAEEMKNGDFSRVEADALAGRDCAGDGLALGAQGLLEPRGNRRAAGRGRTSWPCCCSRSSASINR